MQNKKYSKFSGKNPLTYNDTLTLPAFNIFILVLNLVISHAHSKFNSPFISPVLITLLSIFTLSAILIKPALP
ncbi:hypothetical protein A1C_02155 [Rickettsia akari str. Hartford]|uniref:Uncharacterized protein n=1 Tax=Rickettsia akari (strain Hartford) TaxID=293614 RepID=A8GMW3_RICAH|nr:hypothetical protein [Rickettsia akari]ABV74738.1 hypothetical protein A1C_02155 [Rickettsia akari str. Hartford]